MRKSIFSRFYSRLNSFGASQSKRNTVLKNQLVAMHYLPEEVIAFRMK